MNDNFAFLVESAGVPARTDVIAYHLQMPVSALEKKSEYKAIYEPVSKIIKYHPDLPTSQIRSLIGLGIVLNECFPLREKIVIQNENIYDPQFEFSYYMKSVAQMLITKEQISIFVHQLKIYKIEELAQQFDVSEEMMYYRLQELGMV